MADAGGSVGLLGLIDEFGAELHADFRRFYRARLADEIEEARVTGRWRELAALVEFLPPEAAVQRALGKFTPLEQIANVGVVVASAARAEFAAAHSKRARLKVVNPIAVWQDERAAPVRAPGETVRVWAERLRGMGAVDMGGEVNGGDRRD